MLQILIFELWVIYHSHTTLYGGKGAQSWFFTIFQGLLSILSTIYVSRWHDLWNRSLWYLIRRICQITQLTYSLKTYDRSCIIESIAQISRLHYSTDSQGHNLIWNCTSNPLFGYSSVVLEVMCQRIRCWKVCTKSWKFASDLWLVIWIRNVRWVHNVAYSGWGVLSTSLRDIASIVFVLEYI